ncbi:MAG: signal peptidase I [Thalassospira sp.]|nr:signal peptidase I [Thalassospira sp.]
MKQHDKPKGSFFTETFKTLIYAGLLALVFRTVAYEPFNIPSESMLPNLLIGDYLFVSKPSYGYGMYSPPLPVKALENRLFFTPPLRGDIIVFRPVSRPDVSYIKRLIGLPGDTVQVRDSILYLNGEAVPRAAITDYVHERRPGGLPEPIPTFTETLPGGKAYTILEMDGDMGGLDDTPVFKVPPGHYFFMGDNRDRSADSRDPSVGFVPEANLVGRADILFFSGKPEVAFWEFWKWPFAVRYDRLLHRLN